MTHTHTQAMYARIYRTIYNRSLNPPEFVYFHVFGENVETES